MGDVIQLCRICWRAKAETITYPWSDKDARTVEAADCCAPCVTCG